MTRLIRYLLTNPKGRAAIRGAGSVLNLGGPTHLPQVMIFRSEPPEYAIRDAWKKATSQFSQDHGSYIG